MSKSNYIAFGLMLGCFLGLYVGNAIGQHAYNSLGSVCEQKELEQKEAIDFLSVEYGKAHI